MDIIYNAFSNYILFNVTFYLSNSILFIIDYYKLFDNLKIQHKDTLPIYKKCIATVMKNTFVATIPLTIYFGYYESNYSEPFYIYICIRDLFVSRLVTEVLFYSIHRLAHIPTLYHFVHKKHHEITTPIGISTVYMTLLDFYFANVLPIYFPVLMLKSHPLTIKLWSVGTTLAAIIGGHSGIKYIADSHDYHHTLFTKNFGTDLFMDNLFGTNYKKTQSVLDSDVE